MLSIMFEKELFRKKIDEKRTENKPFRFLELGCGSGAIGLALIKHLNQLNVDYMG